MGSNEKKIRVLDKFHSIVLNFSSSALHKNPGHRAVNFEKKGLTSTVDLRDSRQNGMAKKMRILSKYREVSINQGRVIRSSTNDDTVFINEWQRRIRKGGTSGRKSKKAGSSGEK